MKGEQKTRLTEGELGEVNEALFAGVGRHERQRLYRQVAGKASAV